jgi:RAB protein geranylgeranyltransferase component A
VVHAQVAKASIIVGDPSYFDAAKTRVVGKVVRSICILNHPIAGAYCSRFSRYCDLALAETHC